MAYKKKNIEECKILWIRNGEVAVDFRGNGYIIKTKKSINKDSKAITVSFTDEGTKDFKLSI